MAAPTLSDALDLVPEAWAIDIAADAEAQGCTLGFTTASGGLRVDTIESVRQHFAAREDDADWQALSAGQRLDECFAAYNGIGWPDLLAELGISPVYLYRM